MQVLKPYQTARLTLDPGRDPSGLTYNLNQSITAVGSGGLTGRGPTEASQTRLDYLPEHATDFAFASLAEQRGFVGSAILLLLYLLVVWRGLRVITVASDLYGAVVAGGLVFALVFQVFVNVGMTMGVAPVTGIPLPFVTVGGSSMVANLLMIGILQSIHARGVLGEGRYREGGRPGRSRARSPQGPHHDSGQGSARADRAARGERGARRTARSRARGGCGARSGGGREAPTAAGAEVVVRVLAGDPGEAEDALVREADRLGTPVVFVQLWPQANWSALFVLSPFVIECRAGEGFPVATIAEMVARASANAEALAARIPVLREPVESSAVRQAVSRTALIGATGERKGLPGR